jgi:hypothetical protein
MKGRPITAVGDAKHKAWAQNTNNGEKGYFI